MKKEDKLARSRKWRTSIEENNLEWYASSNTIFPFAIQCTREEREEYYRISDAKGDGITDDTAAIQKKLQQAKANTLWSTIKRCFIEQSLTDLKEKDENLP